MNSKGQISGLLRYRGASKEKDGTSESQRSKGQGNETAPLGAV